MCCVKVTYFFVDSSLAFRETFVEISTCVQQGCTWIFWTGDLLKHVDLKFCIIFCTFFAKYVTTCEGLYHVFFTDFSFAYRANYWLSWFLSWRRSLIFFTLIKMNLRMILIEKLAWVMFIWDLRLIERSGWGIKKILAGLNKALSDWLRGWMELPEKLSWFEKMFHGLGYFLAFSCGKGWLDLKLVLEGI